MTYLLYRIFDLFLKLLLLVRNLLRLVIALFFQMLELPKFDFIGVDKDFLGVFEEGNGFFFVPLQESQIVPLNFS